ncbi:Agroclavine dehydrogenase [Lasiodiplodia theobromae]|uniref:Agroclavine dehydrogenase n=1 Tax=Lasiodiplodia theobromae TaxID=45133 RepID=A0A5N5CYV6_9PEZI|nr:Agroclavine dehydrogenase [Lasiodiplodia theobromae]KAB2570558.1 Agroclavine dehydrogenase [Lasiodiplodia theobromae]KAF4541731.1 Agroclavine dehydrogenase [Lasiodiplodia theobromae]
MAILVTGGTAKTSVRLGAILRDTNVPFVMAARRPDAVPAGMPKVKFDWYDKSTWSAPFDHSFPGGETITAAYIVLGADFSIVAAANDFIDYAVKKHGVKRFVMCGGGSSEPGTPMAGEVWQHLIDVGVEHCVLKPTWFMDNFSEGWHLQEIRTEGKLHTATGDGRIPFISAKDIAAMAAKLLTTADKLKSNRHRVTGPEKLTYDEITEKLSKGIGKKVEHVKMSEEDRRQNFLKNGLPEYWANYLAMTEANAAKNESDGQIQTDELELITGSKGQTFDEFVEENKAIWQ